VHNTIVTISSRNSSDFAHRLARETSLFMQTMQTRTALKNVALFVPKIVHFRDQNASTFHSLW
jgi:hypothetical protein